MINGAGQNGNAFQSEVGDFRSAQGEQLGRPSNVPMLGNVLNQNGGDFQSAGGSPGSVE